MFSSFQDLEKTKFRKLLIHKRYVRKRHSTVACLFIQHCIVEISPLLEAVIDVELYACACSIDNSDHGDEASSLDKNKLTAHIDKRTLLEEGPA